MKSLSWIQLADLFQAHIIQRLQQNMVSHPKKVTYPLPLYGHFYEDYLIAISSHRPLLPFKADIHRSEEDLLKQAHDRNQVYQRLLK